ncbi:universal stress protein [Amycolatopsis samaneae]|uniref:Universal stress protein n=1 Tax=Amycolatopsis samaneae TaxID=664691 RepID=A0ABW5GR43_9PSEU
MNTPESGTAAIVAGVDGTPGSTDAVCWAATTAANRGVPLVLAHGLGTAELYRGQVVPPPEHLVLELRNRGHQLLRQARNAAKATADAEVHLRLSEDTAAAALLELSGEARMIVLGASEHTRVGAVFGDSVTLALAAHAHCPVVSVRGGAPAASTATLPVVVGVDGTPLSEHAVATAFAEASARDTYLVAVHAWGTDQTTRVFGEVAAYYAWSPSVESETAVLAERLAGWHERYPDLDVQRVVVRDEPRTALLQWSHKAQLLVVGSRGRGGFAGLLLGSTSQALLRHASCPVLIATEAATI